MESTYYATGKKGRAADSENDGKKDEVRSPEWSMYNEKESVSKPGNELSTQLLNEKWKSCAWLDCNEMKFCVSCTQTPFQMQFYAMMAGGSSRRYHAHFY